MGDDINKVLEAFPTNVSLSYAHQEPGENEESPPKKVILVLQFSDKGFGFGEVTLVQTLEGTFLDTECMSLERVKRYFGMLLDKAIIDGDNDPEKHRLYNREMGRSCGAGCLICNE